MGSALAVVVVTFEMARELPRTLRSLSPEYQRGISREDYEVVLVDNGSAQPFDPAALARFTGRLRHTTVDPAPRSPARAANVGIATADAEIVGLIVDGARMASPGLLVGALRAARLAPRPVIATLGWHLGPARHMHAVDHAYDQEVEDQLLETIGWEEDGYRLFEHATLAGSSARGWFGPMGESSALFMPKDLWEEVEGLDERFTLPGGGLVNHDLYRRACALDGVELIVLLGEGTFHQIHGGAATSRRLTWDAMHDEYMRLRGAPYTPPQRKPLYCGTMPASALRHLDESVRWAMKRSS